MPFEIVERAETAKSEDITDIVPVRRGRGRPSTLEVRPEIAAELIRIVTDGNYIETAFRAVGLSADTYYNWVEMAEAGNPNYSKFIVALKNAEAKAEIEAVREMRREPKLFLASATFLERRFRARYGRSDRHTVDASVNIRVEQVDYSKLAKATRHVK